MDGYSFEQLDAMLEPEVIELFLQIFESYRMTRRAQRGLMVSRSFGAHPSPPPSLTSSGLR